MKATIVWLGARRDEMRAVLDVTHGEPLVATTFPLRPDREFSVIHLHAGVNDDGFLVFDDEVLEGFQRIVDDIAGGFSAAERQKIDMMIRDFHEIGSLGGASQEEMAVVVRSGDVTATQERIDALFARVEEPLR